MTARSIRLSTDLTLPVDVVTQTVAVLAKRRAGKSYTMRRLVEQLHRLRVKGLARCTEGVWRAA